MGAPGSKDPYGLDCPHGIEPDSCGLCADLQDAQRPSETPRYWRDASGRYNCAHGVLLYGRQCIRCERGEQPASDQLGSEPDACAGVGATRPGRGTAPVFSGQHTPEPKRDLYGEINEGFDALREGLDALAAQRTSDPPDIPPLLCNCNLPGCGYTMTCELCEPSKRTQDAEQTVADQTTIIADATTEQPSSEQRACEECGMLCALDEYHPYAACLMFKGCHDAETVRANLAAAAAYGAQYERDAIEAERNRTSKERCSECERLRRDVALRDELMEAMTDCIGTAEGQTFEQRAEELIVTEVAYRNARATDVATASRDCPVCSVGNPGVYVKDGRMVCPHRPADGD